MHFSDSPNEKYSVTPRILKSQSWGRVKIIPRQANAGFDRAGKISAVELYGVSGLNKDQIYSEAPEASLQWRLLDGGAMEMEAFFAGEQEYTLLIKVEDFGHPAGEKRDFTISIALYAVAEDLYGQYPFRGDLHMHSEQSDGELATDFMAARGRTLGLDFLAITDHSKYFPSMEACRIFSQLPSGLLVCAGEEVQLPDTPVHIVNFGGKFSVNEAAAQDPGAYRKAASDLAGKMKDLTPGNDPFFAGSAQWVFDKIRAADGLSVFCHCFWQRHHYMINEAITRDIIKNCRFDAMEVISGHGVKNYQSNNLQSVFYSEYADKNAIAPVGSSDAHMAYIANEFGCEYTVCWAGELTREAIIESIRSRLSVAAEEMTGHIPRFYGSFRLVRYASFLRRHYFPQHDKLCFAEGVLLKEVLAGNKELLPAVKLAAQAVERYRKTLFGC